MKVIHIISNKVWGGGEQYVYDLARRLVSDGHEVELVARQIPSVWDKLKSLNVPLTPLTFNNLLKMQADVVHVHNFKDARKVAWARMLSGKKWKLVVTRHLVRQAKNGGLDRWLYKKIDRLVFVSELARKTFFSSSPRMDRNKTEVILNSICPQAGGEAEDLRKNLPEDTVVLMYHGRIAKEKGLEFLVRAMGKMKNLPVCLFILGTGDNGYRNALMTEIKALGLDERVKFLGFKDNVIPYIGQCDIGVIPSVDPESSSLSCMEYMSVGKCVVTTDHGGQAEYVTNGENGILVPPGDSDALAEGIRTAMNQRDGLGAKARATFNERLSYSNFYSKIVSLYR